jgi:hypothetical protein
MPLSIVFLMDTGMMEYDWKDRLPAVMNEASMDKEVGFPALVHRADVLPDKRHMVRPHRFPAERHQRLVRRTITLAVVA